MDYVWTGMCTTIKKWLNQCVTYKLFSQQQPYTPPQIMPIPSDPFQFISIDVVGPLPQTFHGYQYILTLIDHLTGWADVFPITNKRGSTIADILVDRVFPQYGFPETLLSDNGTEFINTDVRNVCKAFGILHKHSTVFHPNSNGKIERFHRTFKQIIAKFAHENNTNWLKQLPAALNAYRTTTYGKTLQTKHSLHLLLQLCLIALRTLRLLILLHHRSVSYSVVDHRERVENLRQHGLVVLPLDDFCIVYLSKCTWYT